MDSRHLWADVTHRLGWTLVHSLWEGAVIGVALLLALLLLRRSAPQTRYIVSVGALGVTVLAVILTFQFIKPPARQVVTLSSGVLATPNSLNPSEEQGKAPVNIEAGQTDSPSLPARTSPKAAATRTVAPIPGQPWNEIVRARVETLLPHLTRGWAIGMLVLGVWHLGGWIAVQRLRVLGVRSADTEIQQLVAALSRRMAIRRSVRVAQSLLAETPMVIGWVRPVILLPISVVAGLSPDQLRGILAHELAHVRRHDYLVNLLQVLVGTALFYHPAVWWVSRRIRLERELCCDDVAVAVCGDRHAYAGSLAALEEVRLAGSLAMAARGNGGQQLLSRVRRLVGLAETLPPARTVTTLAAVCLAIAIVAVACVNSKSPTIPRNPKVATSNTIPVSIEVDGWKRRLDNGVQVELVGVSTSPSDGRPWWLADGTTLAKAPYPHLGASAVPAANEVALEVVVRLAAGRLNDFDVKFETDPRGSFAGHGGIAQDEHGETHGELQWMYGAAVVLPRDRREFKVRVGVAASAWKTIAESNGGVEESTNGPDRVTISTGGPSGQFITAGRNLDGMQHRVIAVGADGVERPSNPKPHAGSSIGSLDTPDDSTLQNGLIGPHPKRYRLQVRPYAWAEFRHVAMAPRDTAPASRHAGARVIPHLGDVVDRLIESHAKDSFAINLASGDVITSTEKLPLDWRPEGIASLRAAKVDLFQPMLASSGYSLTGVDMRLLARFEPRVAGMPRTLESIEEAECRSLLEGGRRMPPPGPGNALVRTDGEGFYVFITRDGVEGVLQVVNWDGRFKLRYKQFKDLVAAALPAGPYTERPATLPLPPPESNFSNTVTRILPWHEPCRGQYLQFLTGRIVSIGEGPGDKSDHAAEFREVENGGADISTTQLEDGVQIAGHGCTFVQLPADDNSGFTVATLLKLYGQDPRPLADLSVTEKDLPCRVAFRTGTGEFGILRIVGIDDTLHGVMLQYQLVKRNEALPAPQNNAATRAAPSNPATKAETSATQTVPNSAFAAGSPSPLGGTTVGQAKAALSIEDLAKAVNGLVWQFDVQLPEGVKRGHLDLDYVQKDGTTKRWAALPTEINGRQVVTLWLFPTDQKDLANSDRVRFVLSSRGASIESTLDNPFKGTGIYKVSPPEPIQPGQFGLIGGFKDRALDKVAAADHFLRMTITNAEAAPATRPVSDAQPQAGGNAARGTVMIPEAVRSAAARSYPEANTQITPVTRADGSLGFRVDYQYRPNLRPTVFGKSNFQDGWAILNPDGYLVESSPWHTGTQGATTLPAAVMPAGEKAVVPGPPKLLVGMWDVNGDGFAGKELKIEITETGPMCIWMGKAGAVKVECTFQDGQLEFPGNNDVEGIKARGRWKLSWNGTDELSVLDPAGKTFSLRRWTQPWPPDARKRPATQAALPVPPVLKVYEDKSVGFRFGVPDGWLPTDAANAGGSNRGAVAFGEPEGPSSAAPRVRATVEAYVQDVGTPVSVEPVRVPQPHYTFFRNTTVDGAPATIVAMAVPEAPSGASSSAEWVTVTVAKRSRFFNLQMVIPRDRREEDLALLEKILPTIVVQTEHPGEAASSSPEPATRPSSRPAAGPATAPAALALADFSPITEVVLEDAVGKGSRCMLNLETGKAFTVAEAEAAKDETWLREQGIDLYASTAEPHLGLIGFDFIAIPSKVALGQDWAYESFPREFAQLKASRVFISGAGPLPRTFHFRMRGGVMGVLEISGFPAAHKVKLRYALLKPREPAE